MKNIYKEIFLDRQRDYYFPILVEKQHKNIQGLKQNKTVETYPEDVMAIDFYISHLNFHRGCVFISSESLKSLSWM